MRKKLTLLCLSTLFAAAIFSGCMRDVVDTNERQIETPVQQTERCTRTRSTDNIIADSLVIISRQQSDLDNFMMGRVIFKTDRYELCVKREDAAFFGVSNELYDEYLLYVERLNAGL